MSSALYRLARACFRARKRVVAAWLLVIVALGGLTAAFKGPFNDEFAIPGASSQTALDQLRMTFPQAADSSATILLIAPPGASVHDARVKDAMESTLDEIGKIEWVKGADSPYSEYIHGALSDDNEAAYARIRVTGSTSTFSDAQREVLNEKAHALQEELPGSEVHMGGEVYSVNMPHITWVEGIGLVVALIVLVAILGSLRGALIPIIAALLGAAQAMMFIVLGAGLMPINSTTTMLALMLALAVGIDYSLFVVSRHRDQLMTGMDAEESAARATGTAGSAVVFAGLTVIVALAGLAIAGIPFLATMGGFAAGAVAIEVALALTFLPAMLGFLGERLRPKKARLARAAEDAAASDSAPGPDAASPAPSEHSADVADAADTPKSRFNPSRWWVGVVTKFPIVTIVVVVAILGALAVPAKDLWLALPSSGRSAPGAPDRVTFDLISKHYGVGTNGPLVVTGSIVESKDPLGVVDGLKKEVEKLPGVKNVAVAVPNEDATQAMLQVIPTTGPDDPKTGDLVAAIRAHEGEWKDKYGVATAVTGFTAIGIDVSHQLAAALLPFGVFVMGLSLVLLMMVFRSIAVPIKAAAGYILSVLAAFGSVALVFNHGVGKDFINLPEAVPVISFLPIMLMGILFGLAMDYEVFLTSRMREEYVHGNKTGFVEDGFVYSAKVVVGAAAIMIAVFAFFVPAGEGVIKPIAFGLAMGVAIDAFLVRMTLGPAVMKLLGERAWYLPRWLDKRLPVMDVEGEGLNHELSLADWPSPDAPGAVYAEGLEASYEGRVLFDGVDLELMPGDTLVVAGPENARRGLLLALSGRLAPTGGEAKIAGCVLPEQAGRLRQRVTFVDGATPDTWAHLGRPRGEVVVVDHADHLEGIARERLTALAHDPGQHTLVLAAPSVDALADVAPAPLVLDLTPAPATALVSQGARS